MKICNFKVLTFLQAYLIQHLFAHEQSHLDKSIIIFRNNTRYDKLYKKKALIGLMVEEIYSTPINFTPLYGDCIRPINKYTVPSC